MEPTRTCEYIPLYNAGPSGRTANRKLLAGGVEGVACTFVGSDPDTFNQMPEARQVPEGLHYSSHEAYANGAYNVFLRNSDGHTVGFLRIRPC